MRTNQHAVPIGNVILIVLAIIGSLFISAIAYDEESWGDDPYSTYNILPNLKPDAPAGTDPYQGPPGYDPNRQHATPLPPLKNGIAGKVFGKREPAQPKPHQHDLSKWVEVGPRSFPASREPLFRLDDTLITTSGERLSPGFYLVKTKGLRLDQFGAIVAPPTEIGLSYQGKTRLRLPLHFYQDMSANSPIRQRPTVLPYEDRMDAAHGERGMDAARLGPYRHAALQVDASTGAAYLLYQVGDLRFKSDPVTVQAY